MPTKKTSKFAGPIPVGPLVGDERAKLICHLLREHSWDEWDLTELYAIENLHAELHEQLDCNHDVRQLVEDEAE